MTADAVGFDATDPMAVVHRLAAASEPVLIGVRHHSPVLAAAMPTLLDELAPTTLLLELPRELGRWLGWLGHPDTQAPVALAVASDASGGLGFYPFADFSPELAAVRWAVAHAVPVVAIDLPGAQRLPSAASAPAGEGTEAEPPPTAPIDWAPSGVRVTELLLERFGVADVEELWDRVVEVPSYGADPEQVRVAALAMGWAMRVDASRHGGVSRHDLVREAWMRREIARVHDDNNGRSVAVIGAFHAAALLETPLLWPDPGVAFPAGAPADEADEGNGEQEADGGVVTSLIPYEFSLLDSRSGYPAGIRDPVWQQAVWAAHGDPAAVLDATGELAVAVCRSLRRAGHVAGAPDATELVRVSDDLARLRGAAAPGRREFVEALESALGQGELLGRGRALAKAAQEVLVSDARGALPTGAPRAGLVVAVERSLGDLGLPGPTARGPAVDLRLDPTRSPLDRRRHLTLSRLTAMGVVYGRESEVEGVGGVRGLTRRWTVRWTPATAATLEFAGRHGVTIEQAAQGALRRQARVLADDDRLTPSAQTTLIETAAECDLPALAREWIDAVPERFLPTAGLADLVALHDVIERIAHGHLAPSTSPASSTDESAIEVLHGVQADLVLAGIAAIEGLAGTEDLADAHSLVAFAHVVVRSRSSSGTAGEGRLRFTLDHLAATGSALAQGAALGALVILGHRSAADAGTTAASWIDAPGRTTVEAMRLTRRLAGFLLAVAVLLEAADALLLPVIARVEDVTDADFLDRLAALREGFDVLSPAARQRFLDAVAERLGFDDPGDLARDLVLTIPPAQLVALARADAAGRVALDRRLPGVAPAVFTNEANGWGSGAPEHPGSPRERSGEADGEHTISPLDRWRLVLGREREQLAPDAQRVARSLDELYGEGRGEGSRTLDRHGQGGGREAPFPTAREWADELEQLFGVDVREEVLARAVGRGRADALFVVDADAIEPSVELLHHILSLRGALPEVKLGRLRALVDRIVTDLVRQLATTLRPAVSGLATPRPSRRPVGPLDLRRTVRANLHTARLDAAGAATLVPERFVFHTRSRRSLDWHLVLVVDVSGSMEVATVYSALVAAVLSALPALSVRFLTFSTVVVDLSDHVDDPLGLLLEVSVGGGTDIGLGLRHAREGIIVPSRTIVAVVSDFDEGTSVGRLLAEVRALAESGAHLLGLAALDDTGAPSFNRGIAEQVAAAGMPVAALSPLELARWIGERING